MSNESLRCTRCQGQLVQGFVPDFSHAAIIVENWHPGKPKKSFWTVTKAPKPDGLPIGAFRCEQCGMLEFYADSKFAAE